MTIDRNIKIGVLSSTIATIIFIYFLDPIMRFIGFILFDVGSSLFQSYIDRAYQQAALLTGPDPAFYIYLLLLLGIAFLLTSTTASLFAAKYARKPEALSEIQKARRSRFHSRLPWIFLVPTILVCFSVLISLYGTMFQLRVISSFNQHLIAITPYTNQQQINLIRSRWTQMQSHADFKTIYSEVDSIASRNHVRLPDNLVFSLKSRF